MWARVVTSRTEPANLMEEKRIFEENVVPVAKDAKGFMGSLWLSNPETGKSLTITMWATKEDMIATEESGWWQEQVDKFKAIMTEPVQREHFEIMSEVALSHVM